MITHLFEYIKIVIVSSCSEATIRDARVSVDYSHWHNIRACFRKNTTIHITLSVIVAPLDIRNRDVLTTTNRNGSHEDSECTYDHVK